MRPLPLLNLLALADYATAKCAANDCLRAVQKVATSIRSEDCESFMHVTVTPATSTIFSTVSETITGSTTRTTTETIAAAPEPSKRWIQQHEVVDLLMGRELSNGPETVHATAVPTYASLCPSPAAYASACSCLGITSTTITASTPSATQILRVMETTTSTVISTVHETVSHALGNSSAVVGNSTQARFGNSTISHLNTTHLEAGVSKSVNLTTSEGPQTRASLSSTSDKYHLKSPTAVGSATAELASSTEISPSSTVISSGASISSSSSFVGFSNTTRSPLFANSTGTAQIVNSTTATPSGANTAKFLNTTSSPTQQHVESTAEASAKPLNASSSALFQNSTRATAISTSSAPFLNVTAAVAANVTSSASFLNHTTAPFLNSTLSALANATSTAKFLNQTTAPFLNSTLSALANATSTAKFMNTTTSAPYMNITSAPFLNSSVVLLSNTTTRASFANTTAPFLNSTSVRFTNTSTAPTPTPTLDTTCGETNQPFKVQVGQPGGLFDQWYLKLSADAIIFVPSANYSTQFSVEDTGHLCAVGYVGAQGNAVIAIASNLTDVTGSAVYFVDPENLATIDHLGYNSLTCDVDGDLFCQEGAKTNWVGCGLGLDITSDGDGVAVVDGWNCTGITLAAIYS